MRFAESCRGGLLFSVMPGIEAEIPDGVPEQVVRTGTENSRTPKFEQSGFEVE